ncbi:DNA-directed RNA polymerase I subunit RPA49 [Hypomesus transpacificus]|uniref:DNA-directed RNA polymerase I subunit RPA49 n=1 Tax=Hypomesus transpacificus TaxID=137520 RepID=UPI001F079404|nr:DNA-directed RNA polymerase I subunit RPA49 [Hypomesus transpacificus]
MDAKCSLVCCEEEREADQAVIVQFSNGTLQKTDQLNFTFYKNVDENHPRKKSRRFLVAESDRLSYVGNNFETGSLKCNNLCRYYVGVLNKETMKMEVHNALLFNMQPVIPGEIAPESDPSSNNQTYRDKVDSLIEAFGSNKQKRALTSRRLNQVGSETLQQAVAKAAQNVIDQKGLEALQDELSQTQAQSEFAPYLPPCHPDATSPDQVYLFDDLLTPVEYSALEAAGSKMATLSQEELQKMRDSGGNQCVVQQLTRLPSEGPARDRQARCAYYLSMLLKLVHLKMFTRRFGEEEECPRIIQNKLMKSFTVETFNKGRVQNMVSTSMHVKVAAYCLALLLHMGHMTADLTVLHRDLGITEIKMQEVAKSMGLKLSRPARGKAKEAGLEVEHRLAILELPLVKYEPLLDNRKRKKMR